jgi:hypothetical protein
VQQRQQVFRQQFRGDRVLQLETGTAYVERAVMEIPVANYAGIGFAHPRRETGKEVTIYGKQYGLPPMPEVRAELHNGRANGLHGLRSREQAVQGEIL